MKSLLFGLATDLVCAGQAIADITPEDFCAFECDLDAGEREAAAKLKSEVARRAFIAAHGMRRKSLAAVTGRSAASFRFCRDHPGGKSRVVGLSDIDTSLTHCAGYAAAAVIRYGRIGIDAEPVKRDISPEVRTILLSDGDVLGSNPLIALWVVKEAVAKAEGYGLAIDLKTLNVDMNKNQLISAPSAFGRPDLWVLKYELDGPFGVAIAVAPPAYNSGPHNQFLLGQ